MEIIRYVVALCLWCGLCYLPFKMCGSSTLSILLVVTSIIWIPFAFAFAFKLCGFPISLKSKGGSINVSNLTPEQRKALKKYVVTKAKEAIRGEKVNVSERDKNLKDVCLLSAGYMCEVDASHKTFLDKNNKPYMEAHHVIPISYQNKYKFDLDILENLICLCPACHKAVHYGNTEAKKEILKKIAEIKPITDYEELLRIYL